LVECVNYLTSLVVACVFSMVYNSLLGEMYDG
jgi:hypothetical protein